MFIGSCIHMLKEDCVFLHCNKVPEGNGLFRLRSLEILVYNEWTDVLDLWPDGASGLKYTAEQKSSAHD